MNKKTEAFILEQMASHNAMVLATVRPDGYPQATTLAYASDGFNLYFAADRGSQKIKNIAHSDKVSVAIARDYADWNQIKGLSMAATAKVLTDRADIERGLECLMQKFPAYRGMLKADDPGLVVVKVAPTIISVLDYEIEFGHTELVRV